MLEMEEKEQIIAEVMDNFDFEKVEKVINVLNLRWDIDGKMEIPTISVLKWRAEGLLDVVMEFYGKGNHHVTSSCEGFKATLFDGKRLVLEFVVDKSEAV